MLIAQALWLFLICSQAHVSALSFPPPLASSPVLLTLQSHWTTVVAPHMSCPSEPCLFCTCFPRLEFTSAALCFLMNFFFKSQLLSCYLCEDFLNSPPRGGTKPYSRLFSAHFEKSCGNVREVVSFDVRPTSVPITASPHSS